ncbi:glycosyltransferase family 4 protein [Porphyrobacter sp. LM 6]|uniref:glycosyltransferase family 4 protein n=1 Tax=Porphyrobacter sp. LM 6 TaxID=1896196 RepID=UPI0008469171|nr:glycosyltransferase family 4 protein [Porphyrobacter sp. LM 6]AOL94447.1 Glycosyl transferases group 1 [Porphyrobacter sp. LM 6]
MSSPAPGTPAAPLTISYAFSQFPLPTQTFAISDIAALQELGHKVVVHTMKPQGSAGVMAGALAALPQPLAILRPNWRAATRWPALLWRYRAAVWRLARLILPQLRRAPVAALTALACMPRALELAEEVRAHDSAVLHLFWSRHAALALSVLRQSGWTGVRTAFVGAYDLVADDFLMQLALDEAEAAFSHAEANRDFIEARARPGLPLHIIHRGIPLPQLDPATPRDETMWLTASALVPEKNVEAVLRLFAEARRQRPELKLTVCGDGPDRARLEALAIELGCEAAVRFAGHVDRQALFGLMHRAGTFLLLSKKASERLPNVIKEALWSGCAVIVSPSEGIEELVPDRGIGLVVDPDDATACAQAVSVVLEESPEAAAARRERARELISSRFSNIDSMARYVAAWQALGAPRTIGQRQP